MKFYILSTSLKLNLTFVVTKNNIFLRTNNAKIFAFINSELLQAYKNI